MPGPVSDSYDPEFSTGANCDEIRTALAKVYKKVSKILGEQPPMYILELVRAKLPKKITAELTEREWRLLRFSLERASESI